ncbi:MAG: ATP-binding protein [Bacteroidales bacterium]
MIYENEPEMQKRIMALAKIGYFKADVENSTLFCSDYICELLDLKENNLSFDEFFGRIDSPYREKLMERFTAESMKYEMAPCTFPLHTKQGTLWMHACIAESVSEDRKPCGYLQCAPNQEEFQNRDTDLKESNELREKRHLQNLYDHMPVGYCRIKLICDENDIPYDYIIVEMNQIGLNLTKSENKDFIGRPASECGLNLKNRLPCFINLIKSERYKTFDFMFPNNDTYGKSILCASGENELIIFFSDMTETIRARNERDRSEKKLLTIYENIPLGIELYDKDGTLLDLNKKDLDLFGVKKKEDALGVNLFDNPNLPDEFKNRIRNGNSAHYTFKYNFSNIADYYDTKRKGEIELITKATVLYDEHQNISNYLLINIDNTEQSIAYNRIQDFENLFSAIADFAKVGYAKLNMLSKEGFAINQWYKNFEEDPKTPVHEIIGIYQRMHPDDRKKMLDFFKEAMRGEASLISSQNRILTKDDTWRWLHNHVMVTEFAPEKGVIEIIGINIDITQQKLIEEQLIKAKEEAESLDKTKSAFIANMSHEIRTPLNAIVGFSNLLAQTTDEEEKKSFVRIIEKNNELLLQLISDILDLSKIEAQTLDFNQDKVDITVLCNEIAYSFSHKTAPNVEIKSLPGSSSFFIETDRIRLHQVLSNLMSNAIKFTEKGSVSLGYTIQGEHEVEFYVEDTGCGIPQDKLPQVFDRFIKLNKFIPGTGLGLSICKNIIEQMGGFLNVNSEEGVGSRFYFRIPIKI